MNTDFAVLENIKEKAGQAYAGPLEHLDDLMKRQDLLLQRAVARNRNKRVQTNAWERFAAISDEEVEGLLRQGSGWGHSPEPSQTEIGLNNQLAGIDEHIAKRVASSIKAGVFLPLPVLSRLFGLTPVEANVLISCLAPEIDARYERLYGYLQDDMTRRRPSVGLVLAFCCESREEEIILRPVFSPQAPLMRYQLIHLVDDLSGGNPFLSRGVKIDGRIASFLLGETGFDSGIQDKVELWKPDKVSSMAVKDHQALVDSLVSAVEKCFENGRLKKNPLFYLEGRARAGKSELVREVSRRLGLPLLVVDAEQVGAGTTGFEKGMFLAFRENLLCQSLLHIRHLDRAFEQNQDRLRITSLMKQIHEMGWITFLSGEKPWSWQISSDHVSFLPVKLAVPEYVEQIEIWKKELQGRHKLDDKELSFIVSKYPSSPGQIKDAVMSASTYAALRGGSPLIMTADIDKGCRAQAAPNLGHLARKIEMKSSLHDIILPPGQLAQLREICNQIHYRSNVYGTWGFGRKLSLGKGLNALFFGPPGTGKTMAAEVIANELCLDLYKIDLSQVVSKYIGETEKNLHQIFREAEISRAILFFDEADALMGKRSDVKDAHDRYANLETAYLLQKMEEYEGVTILATNLRQNMDEAFTRRIRFIIEFPFPDEERRLRIWQGIWPRETPLAETVDLPFMAKRFKLSGGNIRNAALAAAFLASSEGGAVDMKHLLNSTKQEFLKMGRLVDDSEYIQ